MADEHDLYCLGCGERETLSLPDMLARLRAAGLLKRAKDPELSLVLELLKTSAATWSCAACGRPGLAIEPTRDEFADEDWGDAKACERCQAIIPAERLELFPNTTLCRDCQSKAEQGDGDTGAAEYCPRCGEVMQLRRARGTGISRFVMECPACRK